jgi:DNA-binding transcriptional LysR family regulator
VNLQQLRYLCAVVDHGLNVSVAADALFTSQPGISKQIRQLEDELGVPIFIRQGKRLAALTAGGEVIVATARRALQELNNLKRVGAEFKSEDTGALAIATTHTQARYVLPPVLKRFAERSKVRLRCARVKPRRCGTDAARRCRCRYRHQALAIILARSRCPATRGMMRLVPKGHPLAVRPLTLGRWLVSDRHLRFQLHRPLRRCWPRRQRHRAQCR